EPLRAESPGRGRTKPNAREKEQRKMARKKRKVVHELPSSSAAERIVRTRPQTIFPLRQSKVEQPVPHGASRLLSNGRQRAEVPAFVEEAVFQDLNSDPVAVVVALENGASRRNPWITLTLAPAGTTIRGRRNGVRRLGSGLWLCRRGLPAELHRVQD